LGSLHFCKKPRAKQQKELAMTGRKWRVSELNLVKGASKQRQAEDRLRADAWRKTREAELEAVVNQTYDGMEVPEMRALLDQASKLMAPIIAEWDRLAAEHYPAEFARPRLGIGVTPGGFPPEVRDKVRRDAAKHLAARHAFMLANSSTYVTETLGEATVRTTDNPEVVEFLERLAVPNRATPVLEPPGPAIGILRKLLPHPEEWGFAGYDGAGSPLLPAPDGEIKPPRALAAPKKKSGG
jgi:hypothetical protein